MESLESDMGFVNALAGRGAGGADTALLVIVRQIMVLTFMLLAVFAACLSRHGSAVHMWLEGSWWLVGTTLAVFLTISGIIDLISSKNMGTNVVVLTILEQVELITYLLLAVGASVARTRGGPKLALFRTAFWIATIILVVLWSVSSLLDIMTSERALPGTIITMATTLVVAVLMIADMCVTQWHGMDAPHITEQQARQESDEPFLARYREEDLEGKGTKEGYVEP